MSDRSSRARAALAGCLLALACSGGDPPAGRVQGAGHGPEVVAAKQAAQREVRRSLAVPASKSILFGDLHVHTTYSIDAFLYALPVFGGAGAHPPADACDFARHCANLDFFSLNDHAEGLTPERWRRSIESVRQCNERAGDPASPDLMAFVGYEWTQMGMTPDAHFGHKNVIVPGLADEEVPPRPISALPDDVMDRARYLGLARVAEAALTLGARPYADFLWWIRRLANVPFCERGVDTRELPRECQETAPTPEVLFEKLAQWGGRALVVPHGLGWGIHAPPGARLDVQASPERSAPDVQRLVEVFSGHGSGERFEPAAAAAERAALAGVCAEPTDDYLPCCWRAGEIVRERCGDLPAALCQARVDEAMRLALEAGRRPHWVLPDTTAADWLDCDQTRGAFKPALADRPHMSAQYALASGDFRWGFIGSSDNHTARAGSGYKQVGRKGMTDARGFASQRTADLLRGFVAGEPEDPARAQPSPPAATGFRSLLDTERTASFLYTGGLVAVHSERRDREGVFAALERREVYATSGPRILLWFDLLGGEVPTPMGGEATRTGSPAFEVRAAGSFVQKPGCPDDTLRAMSAERIDALCLGECHHPGDERVPIEAIEVVRIRPRSHPGEDVAALIEDPWLRLPCPGDGGGCRVRFEDAEFAARGRDTIYYVRALQAETPAINGANARVRRDASGAWTAEPCSGGFATPRDDDCLAPVRERAWSSPIFVEHGG
ncbi:MAG: DUF3604 domain-containing protein [Myxococcota bacterium]